MPRAKPTPACSERKSILRALFIHFLWGQMLSPKAIISGTALITAEVWEQAKHRMEKWRSLLSCGLHQEPSQTSWNTSPAVPLQLPCGHPKDSPTYLSLLLTELVPADIMTGILQGWQQETGLEEAVPMWPFQTSTQKKRIQFFSCCFFVFAFFGPSLAFRVKKRNVVLEFLLTFYHQQSSKCQANRNVENAWETYCPSCCWWCFYTGI